MNLQEELKALKQRIAELEEQAKQEREFPQFGDDYWYVSITGRIFTSEWDGFTSEKDMFEIGNIYKTKQQAEFAVEKLKVEAELRKFSRPFTYHETNWYLIMDFDKEVHYSYKWDDVAQGAIYFESKEKAQQAIETVGEERIKKYIFGVED